MLRATASFVAHDQWHSKTSKMPHKRTAPVPKAVQAGLGLFGFTARDKRGRQFALAHPVQAPGRRFECSFCHLQFLTAQARGSHESAMHRAEVQAVRKPVGRQSTAPQAQLVLEPTPHAKLKPVQKPVPQPARKRKPDGRRANHRGGSKRRHRWTNEQKSRALRPQPEVIQSVGGRLSLW